MTGGADYLPVLADCERALGRPENALKLAKEARQERLSPEMVVEMTLVEAGARDDLGQRAEALRVLKNAIAGKVGGKHAQSRLRYAYADLLERAGDEETAKRWFTSSAGLDPEQELDAEERVARLEGLVLEVGEDDAEDEDEDLTETEQDADDVREGSEDDDRQHDDDERDGDDKPEDDVDLESADDVPHVGEADEDDSDEDDSDEDDSDEDDSDEHDSDEHASDEHASDDHDSDDEPSDEELHGE